MRTRARAIGVALAALAVTLTFAAQSSAMTISSFSLTPDTTAAGGHPSVAISTGFAGGDAKDLILHLPPGLVGNPAAATLCTQSDFASESCASSSVVGSISANVALLGLLPTTVSGQIFNLQPTGSEPARFGFLLRAIPLPLGHLPTDVMMQSPITVRTNDFGLDSTLTNIPNSVGGLPLTISGVSLTLNSRAARGPFTQNPTSCKPATTSVDVVGYDGTRSSASTSFTPTACAALPFAPSVAATIGGRGGTADGAHPLLDSVISQPTGQATISSVRVLLPATVSVNFTALKHTCQLPQYEANACPANSQVGSAIAVSPLLAKPLNGRVIVAMTPGASLPSLVVQVRGALPVTLVGTVDFVGARARNTFSNIPDVPLSRFELRINGGRNGLLTNNKNLCKSVSRVGVTLTGHNGKVRNAPTTARVSGC
jgi:hypothetical protein